MKAALAEALGTNGQLLIDLIPELLLVIGPQPPAAAAGAAEAQTRLSVAIQRFVRVFCAASHPLVIFIDDLQWADSASLWLLRSLLTDPECRHLLVLGAYRDSEVDEAHPLKGALHELHKQGIEPSEITIAPLELSSVRILLAETLREGQSERVSALAAQVVAKTQGNPFFLSQFLMELHRSKLLELDRRKGRWEWDPAAIASAPVTENVVDLMASRIRLLEPGTQRLVSLAACVGHQFDLLTLATIADMSPACTAAALWPALRETLLVPIGLDYRLLPAADAMDELEAPPSTEPSAELDVSYRFLHDRVQQAAYSLIRPEDREEVHLRIGRRLRKAFPDEPRAEALFELIRHLNAGAPRIVDRDERIDLARLNASAAKAAKASAAYASAESFCAAGVAALDERSWDELYDLTFTLHRERAECEFMAGHLQQAEAHVEELLAHIRLNWQRGDVFGLRTTLYTTQGRFSEAVAAGRQGLSLLGIDMPTTREEAETAFAEELAAVDRILAGRAIESILDAPVLTDPERQTILRILAELMLPVYMSAPHLYSFVMAKSAHLSLLYGNFPTCATIYVCYGFFLAGVLGRYAESLRFGKLALAIVEKFDAKDLATVVYFTFGYYFSFGMPMREAAGHFVRVQQLGFESGDFVRASSAFSDHTVLQFRLGSPLDRVRDEVERAHAALQRHGFTVSGNQLVAIRQTVACLQGETAGPTSLSDDGFNEDEWLKRIDDTGLVLNRHYYHLCKLQLLFLHGDIPGALAMVEGAERTTEVAQGQHWTTELPFWAALVRAALYPTTPVEEQPRLRELLAEHHKRLVAFADGCPENARHQQMLVAAEIARIEGRPSDAMEYYEQAIALAQRHGLPNHEALANELYARFHQARGQTKVAQVYMTEAHYGYVRWGAVLKASQLKKAYPSLLPPPARFTSHESPATAAASVTSGTASTMLVDVTAALRAAQAISSEIILDRVILRVMRIVLANAGAERGFLILNRRDELVVEAFLRVAPDEVQVGLSTPLESRADLAQSVVQLVARTSEPVVLNDASRDPRFAGDGHIVAAQPKSLLCIALTHQGRVLGVLYLENNVTQGAFTEGQIELLQMLCAQAAIALENSFLYAHVQDVGKQLQQANEHLESQVAQRTEELRSANDDLQSRTDELRLANERLQHELVEREKAELSRVALQEDVIRMQSEMLEELSTPLIPISDQVLVLPLIGTVDARRAERMLTTILNGVQSRGVRVVIIDITGLKQVDTQVANTLMHTASALRLLGAEVVITGMRAEVARVVVGLGVNLGTLVTHSTLQRGIVYAGGHAVRRA
jgi:predicted ATPase/GAF domain-containing protein